MLPIISVKFVQIVLLQYTVVDLFEPVVCTNFCCQSNYNYQFLNLSSFAIHVDWYAAGKVASYRRFLEKRFLFG